MFEDEEQPSYMKHALLSYVPVSYLRLFTTDMYGDHISLFREHSESKWLFLCADQELLCDIPIDVCVLNMCTCEGYYHGSSR